VESKASALDDHRALKRATTREKGNHKGKGQPQGKRATTREKGNHKGKGQPQGIAPTFNPLFLGLPWSPKLQLWTR